MQYQSEIEKKLKNFTYDEHVKWLQDMKEKANTLFKE